MKITQFNQLQTLADCLFTQQEVEAALDKLVAPLTADLATKNPLILSVMNGALPTMGYLVTRLHFPLEMDYVHATRYRGAEQGGSLVWRAKPETPLTGRHILLVDDILDQGITLAAIRDVCMAAGAASVKTLVLGQKIIAGFTPAIAADFCALRFPDRYVFGYGMDYQNYWRNAPGIFALKE